jgi:hypothetical protein
LIQINLLSITPQHPKTDSLIRYSLIACMADIATLLAARISEANSASCPLRYRVIDMAPSSRRSLISTNQARCAGFSDKILSLYSRSTTLHGFQAHLQEMYDSEVLSSLISSATAAVADEVRIWQSRPLNAVHPIVYLDCIHIKVREGAVRGKAAYLVLEPG